MQVEAVICGKHEETIDDTTVELCHQVDEEPNTHVTAEIARDITKLEKTTLLSSMCYKIDISLTDREGITRLSTAILDTGADPNSMSKGALSTSLVTERKWFHIAHNDQLETQHFMSMAVFLCALISEEK